MYSLLTYSVVACNVNNKSIALPWLYPVLSVTQPYIFQHNPDGAFTKTKRITITNIMVATVVPAAFCNHAGALTGMNSI